MQGLRGFGGSFLIRIDITASNLGLRVLDEVAPREIIVSARRKLSRENRKG